MGLYHKQKNYIVYGMLGILLDVLKRFMAKLKGLFLLHHIQQKSLFQKWNCCILYLHSFTCNFAIFLIDLIRYLCRGDGPSTAPPWETRCQVSLPKWKAQSSEVEPLRSWYPPYTYMESWQYKNKKLKKTSQISFYLFFYLMYL